MRKTTILSTVEGEQTAVDVRDYITSELRNTFSADELDAIVRYGTLVGIAVDKALTVEGEVGGEAFIVVSGSADVTVDGVTVATVSSGEIVGEHALITETPRNADVIATVATSVMAFTSREFGALLAACPQLSTKVQGLDAERNA